MGDAAKTTLANCMSIFDTGKFANLNHIFAYFADNFCKRKQFHTLVVFMKESFERKKDFEKKNSRRQNACRIIQLTDAPY